MSLTPYVNPQDEELYYEPDPREPRFRYEPAAEEARGSRGLIQIGQLEPLRSIAAGTHPALTLSPSQVNSFLGCQASWYYQSQLKLPAPPSKALALGQAVHAAAANALETKREGEPVFLAAALDTFDAAWSEQSELAELPAAVADETGCRGRAMVSTWYSHALASIEPAEIETPRVGNIGGVPVRAIVDCLTQDGTVIDLKTASRKPAGVAGSHLLQITTYAWLTSTAKARIDTLTSAKTPAYVRHSTNITISHKAHAAKLYPMVREAMDSGLYLPNRSSLFCSRSNCAFWRQCEDEYGGQVKAGHAEEAA
jgi:CRISPR/Cas system-associated exonuclease Cas4 (RecB family)